MENDYEKKISCLENEISDLQVELKKEQEAFNEIMRIVSRFGDIMQSVISQNETFKVRFDNLPYELTDAIQRKLYWLPEIMTVEQTIEEIVTNHKSICRFGDGEIGIIYDQQRWKFQRCDMGLAERLKEVITSNEADIMIGINDFYGDLSHRSPEDRDPIRSYITPEIRMQHYELLQKGRTYANARISRNWTMQMVLNQKRIWENRECVFIEGKQTRMGVGNDLFDNAASVERILCPAENAYDRYDDIYNEAIKQPKEKLILIALGPTASVLAYDLAKAVYQAIDLGHADLSYEWLIRNHGKKTEVKNKYNNEYPDGDKVEDIVDHQYQSQIIADFSII